MSCCPSGIHFSPSWGLRWSFLRLSDRSLYLLGQGTIPSDTVCFPAKLMHGHVRTLIDSGVKTIFYPCMTYNLNENLGDNHYNCPVVAYYPEIIVGNLPAPKDVTLITDYVGLHRKKDFPQKMQQILARSISPALRAQQVRRAMEARQQAYHALFRPGAAKGAADHRRSPGPRHSPSSCWQAAPIM